MYVYILKSITTPGRFYVRSTHNLDKRLDEHNSGLCKATRKHRPWRIKVSLVFENRRKAELFEEYLKSGSGREFTKRHF